MIATLPVPSRRWLPFLLIGSVLFLVLVWVQLPAQCTPSSLTAFLGPAASAGRAAIATGVEGPSRLPERYWLLRTQHPGAYSQPSCTRLATRQELTAAAAGWQLLAVPNGSVYLYGGYWDDRFEEPLVRVLLYCDVSPPPPLYCQLWYPDDNAPLTVAAELQYAWRREWGGPIAGVNEPYIASCRARRHRPDPPLAPLAVSLVLEPCQRANNVLDVQGAPAPEEKVRGRPDNGSIAVCLKWLDYRRDVSAHLVEWVQLLKAFGASTLYVHVVHAHPNVVKVLSHYAAEGFAQVSQLAHPPQLARATHGAGARDFHDLRRELLPLNDCLYRAARRHALLAAIDMDEIIVPVRDGSWTRLVAREAVESGGAVDALVFANYYLLDGAQRGTVAPPPARMLAHVWRARNPNPPGNTRQHTPRIFPEAWKETVVIGIHKLGKPATDPASYRPMRFLSTLGKLYERIILDRLKIVAYFHHLLPPVQFGLRSMHICIRYSATRSMSMISLDTTFLPVLFSSILKKHST
ncbi:hypothetical protein O3G_MSEX015088 [Manduca sexta]|uniref:Glycosyltransferase family 92 protein n=2 Tax=Manduca sexta TaxID=7130 RepID=A0A921ZYA1_MANSE|nr:hypothetical protein O3G_MSEX015088 [Manduca sexta]